MALPIRTTLVDIDAVCAYLATKPTGATVAEAKTVLDSKHLDGRKLAAFKFWGLTEDSEGRLKLTESGRKVAKDKGARRNEVLRAIVKNVRPYAAAVERAVHRKEFTVTATEVAAHWHEHFKEDASGNDKILNDQAVCFFQIAEGADLGVLTIGRKGQATRFDFDGEVATAFANSESGSYVNTSETLEDQKDDMLREEIKVTDELTSPARTASKGNRVFITHGKNKKILEQVKELVRFGKFEPVISQEHETAAKPVPAKVMDDMRSCQAAVIHVGAEGVLYDKDRKEYPQINGNVLIEIGAAMALYGHNFILLVEEGVKLPSNLQGLYECRYEGNELNMPATMKILKAFSEFK